MNIFKMLAVATIIAGSTGFAEAKQASSHFDDQRPAQEEGVTMGRSVGADPQSLSRGGVEQLPSAGSSFEALPPARGPYQRY
ncbi:MAG: hypothetical protein WDN46_08160 [Methylocella sp.]